MSLFALSKILSSSLSLSTGIFQLSSWILFGRRESEEVQLLRKSNEKLDLIQKQLDQFWVIQNKLVPEMSVEVAKCGQMIDKERCDSFLMIDDDGCETLLIISDHVSE